MNPTPEKGNHTSRPTHKTPKRSITFCPTCGSTNVFWASGLPQLWSLWECRNCGYRGALILKDGELARKLQEDYAKKSGRC